MTLPNVLMQALIEPLLETIGNEVELCKQSQTSLYHEIERLNAELQMFIEICPGDRDQLNLLHTYFNDLSEARRRVSAVVGRLLVIARRLQPPQTPSPPQHQSFHNKSVQ